MSPFLHGLTLALSGITSPGPQNFFLIHQGVILPRFRAALPAACAAALCDTALIATGALGFAWLGSSVGASTAVRRVLFLLTAAVLARIAWQTWRADARALHAGAPDAAGWSVRRRVGYTLGVSLLNPPAVFDTVVTLGGTAQVYQGLPRLWFVLASVLVSWAWYPSLAYCGRFVLGVGRRWLVFHRAAAAVLLLNALYLASLALRSG